MKQRITQFNKSTDVSATESINPTIQATSTENLTNNQNRPGKTRPKSEAFELFEKKGVIISPVSFNFPLLLSCDRYFYIIFKDKCNATLQESSVVCYMQITLLPWKGLKLVYFEGVLFKSL